MKSIMDDGGSKPSPIINDSSHKSFKKQVIDPIPEFLKSTPAHEIFEAVKSSCKREQESWAMATTLAIASGLTQGFYKGPTGTKLATYTVVLGYIGFGKNDYTKLADLTALKLRPSSVIDDPASIQGLKRLLSEDNNRFFSKDEIINFFMKIFKSNSAEVANMFSDICSVWGDAILKGQSNKSRSESIGTIFEPNLTIFGNGTTKSLHKLIDVEDFVDSGLLSRFDFVLAPERFIPFKDYSRSPELPSKILDMISHNLGLSSLSKNKEFTIISWQSNAVKREWTSWAHNLDEKNYRAQQSSFDMSWESHTLVRLAEKALRYATLCTLLNGRRELEIDDLYFGMNWASWCRKRLLKLINEKGIVNEKEEYIRKIIDFIRKEHGSKGATKSQITRKFRHLKRRLREEIFEDLMESGDLSSIQICGKGKKPITIFKAKS